MMPNKHWSLFSHKRHRLSSVYCLLSGSSFVAVICCYWLWEDQRSLSLNLKNTVGINRNHISKTSTSCSHTVVSIANFNCFWPFQINVACKHLVFFCHDLLFHDLFLGYFRLPSSGFYLLKASSS